MKLNIPGSLKMGLLKLNMLLDIFLELKTNMQKNSHENNQWNF